MGPDAFRQRGRRVPIPAAASCRHSRRHSGRIVNISSIWGSPARPARCTTPPPRPAVISFTRALAQEVGPSGVTVSCVPPASSTPR
ncbi:MAG: SDR family NAD(P)-dependent oxidoreductase [Anaerotruncus massiliensis (ex Togo et al. 2019)]